MDLYSFHATVQLIHMVPARSPPKKKTHSKGGLLYTILGDTQRLMQLFLCSTFGRHESLSSKAYTHSKCELFRVYETSVDDDFSQQNCLEEKLCFQSHHISLRNVTV